MRKLDLTKTRTKPTQEQLEFIEQSKLMDKEAQPDALPTTPPIHKKEDFFEDLKNVPLTPKQMEFIKNSILINKRGQLDCFPITPPIYGKVKYIVRSYYLIMTENETISEYIKSGRYKKFPKRGTFRHFVIIDPNGNIIKHGFFKDYETPEFPQEEEESLTEIKLPENYIRISYENGKEMLPYNKENPLYEHILEYDTEGNWRFLKHSYYLIEQKIEYYK